MKPMKHVESPEVNSIRIGLPEVEPKKRQATRSELVKRWVAKSEPMVRRVTRSESHGKMGHQK